MTACLDTEPGYNEQERAYWELWKAFNLIYGEQREFMEFVSWMDGVVYGEEKNDEPF